MHMKELTIEEKAQRYDAWLAWLEKQGEQIRSVKQTYAYNALY